MIRPQRLLLSGILLAHKEQELREVVAALDPLSLTEQVEALQDALVRHTVLASSSILASSLAPPLVRFAVTRCLAGSESAEDVGGEAGPAAALSTVGQEPSLRAKSL